MVPEFSKTVRSVNYLDLTGTKQGFLFSNCNVEELSKLRKPDRVVK
jgi:hypothetical protein